MKMTLKIAWKKRAKLRAEGDKLWAEGAKIRAEGDKLWAEGAKIGAEGAKIRAEGDKLRAEGDKLRAEGDKLWACAVIEIKGNVTLEWFWRHDNAYACIVDGKDTFEPLP